MKHSDTILIDKLSINTSENINVRIALLADIHGFIPDSSILYKLNNADLDYIIIAGDLVDEKRMLSREMIIFLENCCKTARTFMALGNHDYVISNKEVEIIRKAGVIVLDNEYIKEDSIYIGGLTSANVMKCRVFGIKRNIIVESDVSFLDRFAKVDGYKVLIDHHPENYPLYTRDKNIDLILSGHAHGGQMRIFGKPLYSTGQGWFPKYIDGIYDNKLVVSPGMSNTHKIPRIGNPKKLILLDIK